MNHLVWFVRSLGPLHLFSLSLFFPLLRQHLNSVVGKVKQGKRNVQSMRIDKYKQIPVNVELRTGVRRQIVLVPSATKTRQ
jgi:hypothetical protein